MKILVISDQFPTLSTPFVLNIVTGLIEKGHFVEVLSCEKGNFEKVHRKFTAYQNSIKIHCIDSVNKNIIGRYYYALAKTDFLSFKSLLVLLKGFNFFRHGRHALSGRYFYEIHAVSKLGNFDIAHAQFGPNGVMIQRVFLDLGINTPYITHFRGYDITKTIRYRGRGYYKLLFKYGSYFIANCNFFLEKLIALGVPTNKTSVVYSGVDENVFDVVKDYNIKNDFEKIIKICSVSRLSAKKGIEFNLRAIAQVIEMRPNLKLHYSIIGEGEEREILEKLVESLKLTEFVTFLGSKNHEFIKEFVPTQDIFLSHNVTSKEGDQDATVNVIKEAYLMGLPVISTFHGGIPELVVNNKTGFLVIERDYNEMALRIIQLVDSEDLRRLFSENGRNYVLDNYLNTMIVDKLLSIYEKVISNQ